MATIIKFIYTMFLFIFLFAVQTKVDGKKKKLPFHCSSLRCCLYTIFFLVLTDLIYSSFS